MKDIEIYRMLHIREKHQFLIPSLFMQAVRPGQSKIVLLHVSIASVIIILAFTGSLYAHFNI